LRTRIFGVIGELATRRPWLVLLVALVLAIAGALLATFRLQLNADTNDLIARDRPFMVPYHEFLREFGDLEFISVVLDTQPDEAAATLAVDRLLDRLKAIPGLREVHGHISPTEQWRLATRAMPETELASLALTRDGVAALLATGAKDPLEDATFLVEEANGLLGRASQLLPRDQAPAPSVQHAPAPSVQHAPTDAVRPAPADAVQHADPRAAAAASAALLLSLFGADPEKPRHPLTSELASVRVSQAAPRYLRSDTGRYLFITILPAKDFGSLTVIEEPLRQVRAAIAEVSAALPGVAIGLTGKPVLQADELITSSGDMVRGAAMGLGFCALLLMFSMRSMLRPLLVVAAFLAAFGWTYGFATLAVGQLNLLSTVFMLVLVAAGLDYGVHVMSRYIELRRLLAVGGVRGAVAEATTVSMRGNMTGAITSMAVFATALFTDFQGLRELGVIAGAGLFFCVVAMGTVLPALIALTEGGHPRRLPPRRAPRGFGFPARRPALTMAFLAVGTLAVLFGVTRVHFEDNLLLLQDPTLDSVRWERRLAEESSGNSWFGAVVVERIEEIPEVLERARSQPDLGMTRSVLDVVALPTDSREALRHALMKPPAPVAPNATPPEAGTRAARVERLVGALREAETSLRGLAIAAALVAPREAAHLGRIATALRTRAERFSGAAGEDALRETTELIADVRPAFAAILEGNAMPLRSALPDAARNSAISPEGRFLVMIHPRENVWDSAHMGTFVAGLRAVDPAATGVPFTHYESLADMGRAFRTMALLSLVLVSILVLLDFRSLLDTALAMLPVGLALLWTFSVMGLVNVSLNLANFFAVPILIGLGVDSSIHILHRYHEGAAAGPTRRAKGDEKARVGGLLHPGSTRRAVIITNLTTTIGFAPLLFANHRGMQSLGMVMTIGNSACLLAVLTVLPAALALRARRSV